MKMAIEYTAILNEALTQPGKQLAAYHAFHHYSLGNQMLAYMQLDKPEPINTYKGWQSLGRQVKKGAKAIELCMPVTCKGEKVNEAGETEEYGYSRFIYRKNWFSLSMTEGADFVPAIEIKGWDKDKALAALEITQETFAHVDGNCQGYAKRRTIAVSELAALPHKTTFHELAHIVLGHTATDEMNDSSDLTRNIKEVEAESVAYILCSLLELPGAEFSRAYIQGWLAGSEILEKSCQRIYAAANKILKAGQ